MLTKSTPVTQTGTRLSRPKQSWLAQLFTGLTIWKERRNLASLDSHLLNDIGVSRDEAEQESRRSTWDAPSRWMR